MLTSLGINLLSGVSMSIGYIQGMDQSRYCEYLAYLGNELSVDASINIAQEIDCTGQSDIRYTLSQFILST